MITELVFLDFNRIKYISLLGIMMVYSCQNNLVWYFMSKIYCSDYCNWEDFEPACNSNDVIVIQSATYGLMNRGRCVKKYFDFLGCSTNLMGFLDAKCSGRSTCKVGISDEDMHDQLTEECPRPYLEADYICQKGTIIFI